MKPDPEAPDLEQGRASMVSSKGPPVVLFPSLAGSVLECHESPVQGFTGTRIWMALSAMLSQSSHDTVTGLGLGSSVKTDNAFVEHMMLDAQTNGHDVPGFKVRPKSGLAGCEYLSDSALLKDGTVIMGRITDMLRKHSYTEFDGTKGSMIGASYDWRLMPEGLEGRDGFFSNIMQQVEAMVAADPEQRPAVVIGFSLGCRIGKYFLHFCHAKRGPEWMANHLGKFIPLGGPFLGSVKLLRAVMVDGSFEPLDALFDESQMLTILRSVPVGRYLQPQGNWRDGMDLPFVFLRDEKYIRIALGPTRLDTSLKQSEHSLDTAQASASCWIRLVLPEHRESVLCNHAVEFQCQNPFIECHTFVLHPDAADTTTLEVQVLANDVLVAEGTHNVSFNSTDICNVTLMLLDPNTQQEQGEIQLQIGALRSGDISTWGSPWMPREHHPLARHDGGKKTKYKTHLPRCSAKRRRPKRWVPARPIALQEFDRMHHYSGQGWQVPSPLGYQDDTVAPPVASVTAIYGINVPTLRTLFLRHRDRHRIGGLQDQVQSAFMLDVEGDVDGLVNYNGLGFETSEVQQIRPDTGEHVFICGDGTVNYQSLRHCATWKDQCEVTIFELPGCDHRGVSSDPRMLELLQIELGLDVTDASDVQDRLFTEASRATDPSSGGTICRKLTNCRASVVVSKSGFQCMNQYRHKFSLWIKLLAILSVGACILVAVFAASADFETIQWFSWGSGQAGTSARYQPWYGSQFTVDLSLGILSYAYEGSAISEIKEQFYVSYDLQLFFGDTTCNTVSQVYTNVAQASSTKVKLGKLVFQGNCARGTMTARDLDTRTNYQIRNVAQNVCTGFGGSGVFQGMSFKMNCKERYDDTPSSPLQYEFRQAGQPSMYVMDLISGGKVSVDGTTCYSVSCTSATSGVLTTASDSAPASDFCTDAYRFPNGAQTQNLDFSVGRVNIGGGNRVNCHSFVEASVTVLMRRRRATRAINKTLKRRECVTSYGDCRKRYDFLEQLGKTGVKAELQAFIGKTDDFFASKGCPLVLEQKMCQACENAGVMAIWMISLTCAAQIPLLWFTLQRTDPARDSRAAKLLCILIAVVTSGFAWAQLWYWKVGCYDEFADLWEITAQRVGLQQYEYIFVFGTSLSWLILLPLLASGCVLVVAFVNFITPVPELFSNGICGPPLPTQEAVENSLSDQYSADNSEQFEDFSVAPSEMSEMYFSDFDDDHEFDYVQTSGPI